MLNFGVGKLWGIPADGSTPIEFGILQDVSVGFSWDKKELYGSSQFPVMVVRSKGKIDCKASFAEINGLAFNFLLNGTASVGQSKVTPVVGAILSAETYEFTGKAGAENLGVYDISNSLVAVPMKLVTSNPTTGQYTYDKTSGKYTFAAADAGKAIKYAYKEDDTTTGTTITLNNPLMGQSPIFKAVLNGQLAGKQITLELNACMTSKFDLAFKQEDFLIPNFDFSAFADASGSPGKLTLGE
jgi:hypothetical protein